MRASQPAAPSHPSARSRHQPPAATVPTSDSSASDSTSSQPPAAPRSFDASITPLHDLFTYSYPTATHSASAPFLLAVRVQSDCLLLTATDLSSLYQACITERMFEDKCRRLNFGATTDRYTGLCDLLRHAVHSNTATQPRVTYSVSGVKGTDCSAGVLLLTFTLRVGSGAGLDVECSWQLPSLLRRVRQTQSVDEQKEQQPSDDPKRRKRRMAVPAEDDLDSLEFPDLPHELLTATSRPHSSLTPAVTAESTTDDELVYSREIALFVHRLLDLHLARPATSDAVASNHSNHADASMEMTQLREQVRLLEQQVAAETERAERTERELRSVAGNGGAGGNGAGGGGHDVADKRKPRQMSDRSVINPGVKKRKARGIHLEG